MGLMSSSKSKFGRDVVISGGATALRSLRNLLVLPLLTHSLTLADYGLWEQIATGVAIVIPWGSLQLSSALIRNLAGLTDRRVLGRGFYTVFAGIAVSSVLLCLAIRICIAPFQDSTTLAVFIPQLNAIFALVVLTSLLNAVLAFLRALRLMIRHSIITLGQNLGDITVIGLALAQGGGLTELLWSVVAIRGLMLILSYALIAGQIDLQRPSIPLLREYMAYSIPLIPNSLFYRVFDAGDRFIIAAFLGNASVGLYAAVYTAGSMFTTFFTPVNFVLFPHMSDLWRKSQYDEIGEYIAAIIRYGAMLFLPMLVATVFLADNLLSLLLPSAYAEAIIYFPILAGGFLIFGFGIMGGNLIAVVGKTRFLLVLDASLALLNILLNIALIPLLGIAGAVLATAISQCTYTFTALRKARSYVPYHVPWGSIIHYAALAILMAIALKLLLYFYYLPSVPLVICGGAIYCALLWSTGGISRRELDYLLSLIK